MSATAFKLKLSTDRQSMGECVRAMLSTILFHRLFGLVTPGTAEASFVTYPVANIAESETLVAEKIKELMRVFSRGDTAEVKLKFFDQKIRKTSWFARTHEVCWEEWVLGCKLVPTSDSVQTSTHKQLQENMFKILGMVDLQKEHIPPITTTDSTPFPYEIAIHSTS